MSEFITIKFGTDTKAFAKTPTAEIARILREIADDFEQNGLPQNAIYDADRKFIGEVLVEGDDE